jgi:hypothetical protein
MPWVAAHFCGGLALAPHERANWKRNGDAFLPAAQVQAFTNSCLTRYWSTNSPARRITVKSMLDAPNVWYRMNARIEHGAPNGTHVGDGLVRLGRCRHSHFVPRAKNTAARHKKQGHLRREQGRRFSYLLYLQDRTLLARRVDRRMLALIGDPVTMASNVALFPPGFHASFWASASGSLLAYRTESSDKPRLTWIFPDGKRQNETGTEDFYTHLHISPNGSRAAMELADGTGNMDVWTWDFARRVKTRQTFDPKADRAPTWAPNGHELAFSSIRTGVWQMFRKDIASGQPEEQLTTGAGRQDCP